MGKHTRAYRPQETALYRVVAGSLEELLQERGAQLPRFIEKALRAFLDCGIIERGHTHAVCEYCGHEEEVPFSCKRRGLCPSCARRMAVDGAREMMAVLPHVPYRHLVVSYCFEVNQKLAFQPELLSRVEQMVIRTLKSWQVARCGGGKVRVGGVLVRHRFGSQLNLQIHCHILLIAGVYRLEGEGVTFVADAAEPTQAELDKLVAKLRVRLFALLKRRKVVTESKEAAGVDAKTSDVDRAEQPRGGLSARAGTMHLYVSKCIAATSREELQRLCEYLLRGPVDDQRLRLRGDGKVAYRLRKADRSGKTTLVLEPKEFLWRLCSLIPGPRQPARRYFDILASGCKQRGKVTPGVTTKKCRHQRGQQPSDGPVGEQRGDNARREERRTEALPCPECGHAMVWQATHRHGDACCAAMQARAARARAPP